MAKNIKITFGGKLKQAIIEFHQYQKEFLDIQNNLTNL